MSWSVTKTLVQQMWDKFDDAVKGVMENKAEQEWYKARARAISECIAIFMTPFFETADDVAKEGIKRYKAKQAGEEYETPGLGIRRYEVAANAERPKPRVQQAPPNQPTLDSVPEDNRKAIKFALESGMFTVEQVARTYKLRVEVVKMIQNS